MICSLKAMFGCYEKILHHFFFFFFFWGGGGVEFILCVVWKIDAGSAILLETKMYFILILFVGVKDQESGERRAQRSL